MHIFHIQPITSCHNPSWYMYVTVTQYYLRSLFRYRIESSLCEISCLSHLDSWIFFYYLMTHDIICTGHKSNHFSLTWCFDIQLSNILRWPMLIVTSCWPWLWYHEWIVCYGECTCWHHWPRLHGAAWRSPKLPYCVRWELYKLYNTSRIHNLTVFQKFYKFVLLDVSNMATNLLISF